MAQTVYSDNIRMTLHVRNRPGGPEYRQAQYTYSRPIIRTRQRLFLTVSDSGCAYGMQV